MYKEKVDFLLNQARKIDPYFEIISSQKLFLELQDEIQEAISEFNENKFDKLEDELGDMIWVIFLLLNKLETDKKINIDNVYKKLYKKFSTRKSFLLQNKKVTKDEAVKIWNDAKTKEGYSKDRLWTDERI